MFDSSELRDELQALKGDVSRLLNTTSEGIFDASKSRADALADQSQGGGWAFHYDTAANMPDEVGSHLPDERFVSGEYVSINEGGKLHTYRVASINRL